MRTASLAVFTVLAILATGCGSSPPDPAEMAGRLEIDVARVATDSTAAADAALDRLDARCHFAGDEHTAEYDCWIYARQAEVTRGARSALYRLRQAGEDVWTARRDPRTNRRFPATVRMDWREP